MTNMTELIKNLRDASVRLYLLKKEGRKNFSAFRMPNGINDDIKEKYCTNLEHFIDGRSFGTYDFVHTEKNALIELETEKVSMWTSIQASLKKADDENVFLKNDNFDDDYSVIVIDYSYRVGSEIVHTYIISKYMKTDTWYKKGVKLGFTANGLVEKKDEIIVLNGCIDVVINGDSMVILNEKNFENIFNYFEAAKKMVEDAKPQIQNWTFLTSVDVFFNKATAGKTRTLRLANALKNSKTDWSKISSKTVKDVLTGDERFVSITFNENDQIVCTDSNADLIIDIIREVYSKQLFTEEIIETKGV